MVMLANVNIKATNEITTTLAQIWRKEKKSASLFLFQFFSHGFFPCFLFLPLFRLFTSSKSLNKLSRVCVFMLSFIVGHREVNIPQFSQHIFYEVYSQYYIFCAFFFHSVFSFLHFLHGLCMWAGASSFFFYLKFILIFTGMHGNEVQKKINDLKKVPSFRYMLSFAILFDAIPVLGSSVTFRSFSFSFFLSFFLCRLMWVLVVCVCVCVFFYYYSFLKHIYTYIDK